jgi:dipeptidyl-peptidase-4
MRTLLFLLLTLAAMSAAAECLTVERIYASPALSGSSLRAIKMSPDGRRVAFLKGRDDDQFQLDLWVFNVADASMQRLIDSRALLAGKTMSEAEKARRERERTAMYSGISHYDWSPDGARLLAALGPEVYLVDVEHPANAKLIASGDIIDPQISPRGHYVSFVRDQNLFVIDLASGAERALTKDGKGAIHNAEAEFVAQEEMSQTSGYWWAKDDSAIAYKRFDESPVPVVRRFEIQADRTDVVEQSYPAAGDPNVLVSLFVVDTASGATRAIDLGPDKDIYLVRADWNADSSRFAFMRQSRDQKRLDLVAVDKTTLKQRVLLSESSKTWINIDGSRPHFLGNDQFIWPSERSGWSHLYLFDADGKLLHPVSSGEWGVDDKFTVDEAAGRVFVTSNRGDYSDKQVFALAIDGSMATDPQKISSAAGWHDVEFSEHGEAFVDTWSDPDNPPQVGVRRADGSLVGWLDHNEVTGSHPYSRYKASHVPTEFGTIKAADGQDMRYSLKKPLGFDPKRRYPVIIFVYGGPAAELSVRHWGTLREQFLAQHGYVVFTLDNRGAGRRRERRFTDVLYRNFGKYEVEDQLVGVEWLARQAFVDPRRIGVFGWSNGGFMTLRMLSAASDKIAAGVAGAPVTDWALYDTHYTEQYMDRPKDNPEGYQDGGVFAHLDGLRSPLLLLHGMADDNVLFTNSTQLMYQLQKRGVQFDLMTYPGAKHGLSTPANQTHVFKTIHRFFDSHFYRDGAPAPQCK